MIYGYARVSTLGQGRDGNGLEVQEKELKARGCEVIYAEAYTGTKEDRPRLSELIEKLQIKNGEELLNIKDVADITFTDEHLVDIQ